MLTSTEIALLKNAYAKDKLTLKGGASYGDVETGQL